MPTQRGHDTRVVAGGPHRPVRGWAEFGRVAREQGEEWCGLRDRHPHAVLVLVVAGDPDHSLGGRHYYGTTAGRALLGAELDQAGLACVTETEQFPSGQLRFPPIDHVCAGPGRGRLLRSRVEGWEKTVGGVRLSDHSGVLAELELSDC